MTGKRESGTSGPSEAVENADKHRTIISYALLTISVVGIIGLYWYVASWLPALPDPENASIKTYPTLWYAISIVSVHGAVAGSALYVALQLVDVGRRMSIPILKANRIPDIVGDDKSSSQSEANPRAVEKVEGEDRVSIEFPGNILKYFGQ